jgi:tight adherence protein C
MLALIAVLILLSVGSFMLWALRVTPVTPSLVRRLEATAGEIAISDPTIRRRRQERSERLREILENLGTRLDARNADRAALRQFLIHAGYTSPVAPATFVGVRVALASGLGFVSLVAVPILGYPVAMGVFGALWGGLVGWLIPKFWVGARARRRQKEMVKALPDALDLLVVCVEAGLGLNQAMVRVAEEIGAVSPVLGEQLTLLNLEIRAGTPREEALRNLGERTGVEDIRSLVAMLIQTDRFGTTISDALRVHADTLRTKRRQRAEEAAAKTAIKMLFPLVFFIFPALFVVILAPAVIQVIEALANV